MKKVILILIAIIFAISFELYINLYKYPNFSIFAHNFVKGYTYVWNPSISTCCVFALLIFILKLYFELLNQDSEINTQRSELERYTSLLNEYHVANRDLHHSLMQTRSVATALRNIIDDQQRDITNLTNDIIELENLVDNLQQEQQQQPQREIHVVIVW